METRRSSWVVHMHWAAAETYLVGGTLVEINVEAIP